MYDTDVGVDIEVMDADDHEPVQSIQVMLQQALDVVRKPQRHAIVHTHLG